MIRRDFFKFIGGVAAGVATGSFLVDQVEAAPPALEPIPGTLSLSQPDPPKNILSWDTSGPRCESMTFPQYSETFPITSTPIPPRRIHEEYLDLAVARHYGFSSQRMAEMTPDEAFHRREFIVAEIDDGHGEYVHIK